MNRKEFLSSSSAILGVGFIAQAFEACSANTVAPRQPVNLTLDLTSVANISLDAVGGVLFVQNIYVIRTGQSAYIALSPTCTHQGCTVNFDSSSKQFNCPCHGGKYDINGKVLNGPPTSPLVQYQVTLSGTILTISG